MADERAGEGVCWIEMSKGPDTMLVSGPFNLRDQSFTCGQKPRT